LLLRDGSGCSGGLFGTREVIFDAFHCGFCGLELFSGLGWKSRAFLHGLLE
jgi:hypothetical protein